MYNLSKNIFPFSELGKRLNKNINSGFPDLFEEAIQMSVSNNPWFPRENIIYSLKAIASSLSKDNLEKWLSFYSDKAFNTTSKKVAVIMAGNIPLVGFHDFLSVLISGNIFIGKLSSQDKFLLPALANELIAIEPSIKNNIIFTEGRLPAFDAVIATGSNNSSRYFEYYFGKYPHIIRKSRTSIAIISGKESVEELRSLCDDIFLYFGLGCRNVNKLYIPQNYDFTVLKKAIGTYRDKLFTHNKFMNNYEYNLSVFLINQISHIDTGFCLLKNDASFASSISVINYEYYSDITDVLNNISANREKIQCIVGGKSYTNDTVTFGKSQQPELWDYADGVNTMKFLIEL